MGNAFGSVNDCALREMFSGSTKLAEFFTLKMRKAEYTVLVHQALRSVVKGWGNSLGW